MKNRVFFCSGTVFAVMTMLVLSACPPPDGADIENKYNGIRFEEVKKITFDNLTSFDINEFWLGGGGATATNVSLSAEKDPTSGSGKSLKFDGRSEKFYRIKFLGIFSPDYTGKIFKISVWVYSDTATSVRLGVFKSGTSDPIVFKDFEIETGWNDLVWEGYQHTDSEVTQLGFEQPNFATVTLVNPFYLDDIVIQAATGEPAENPGASTAIRTRDEIEQEINSTWAALGYTVKPTKYIALTYDDGPTEKSQDMLDALEANNLRATFFIIGNKISARPEVLRAMRDAGHELANHSWSHPGQGWAESKSFAEIEAELQQCTDAIYAATSVDGKPVLPRYFRSPNVSYSANLTTVCTSKGFPLMHGASTQDYNGGANSTSAQVIANKILSDASEWGIILSHDPASGNAANILGAIPLVVAGLRERGYYPLTLNEMLVMRNGTLLAGKRYDTFVSVP
jgi:peptidoglycan/xylan/chitin deacetylase (PgdA/CDA1 family)